MCPWPSKAIGSILSSLLTCLPSLMKKKTLNGLVSITSTMFVHKVPVWRTDGRTQSQKCYYIPSATRYAHHWQYMEHDRIKIHWRACFAFSGVFQYFPIMTFTFDFWPWKPIGLILSIIGNTCTMFDWTERFQLCSHGYFSVCPLWHWIPESIKQEAQRAHIVHLSTMWNFFDRLDRTAILIFRSALGRGHLDLSSCQWIPFRGEVENVSANQRVGWPSCFSDRREKKNNLVDDVDILLPVKFH